jgi:hypothetical protein
LIPTSQNRDVGHPKKLRNATFKTTIGLPAWFFLSWTPASTDRQYLMKRTDHGYMPEKSGPQGLKAQIGNLDCVEAKSSTYHATTADPSTAYPSTHKSRAGGPGSLGLTIRVCCSVKADCLAGTIQGFFRLPFPFISFRVRVRMTRLARNRLNLNQLS